MLVRPLLLDSMFYRITIQSPVPFLEEMEKKKLKKNTFENKKLFNCKCFFSVRYSKIRFIGEKHFFISPSLMGNFLYNYSCFFIPPSLSLISVKHKIK